MTGSSQPNDIDLNQSFGYDRRNRLASWTQGQAHGYGYDELGNLTNNAGTAQAFSETRPHAIQSGGGGATTYGHDADGNVTSIVGGGSSRYFQFDSASRLVCADSVQGGCALSRIHYDVDGKRVFDDDPDSMKFTAFVDDTVNLNGGLLFETRIEIWAFGERIAYKRSGDDFRTSGGLGGAPGWGLPPAAFSLLAGMTLLGLLLRAHGRGALVLVIQRPGYAGVSALLVVILVLGPVPGARVSKAGGGGDANFYWELTDPLGTGMVMLDETGARQVHRTYSPFGVEHAAVGNAQWLPRRFAGHREDKDSGLLYMQARWMDADSGTFLSVDPVVPDAGDPQAFNAYTYAQNNPVSFTDPTGMCPAALMGGGCEGKWYGYAYSIQGYEAASAEVINDNLAAYGWQPGSVAANLGAFDGYPSLGEFFGGFTNFFAPGFESGVSAGADQGGGFWRGVGNVLGRIWNLPNTIIGAAYGLAGMAVGAVASLAWGALHVASLGRLGGFSWFGGGISFANGQIQFTGSVLQRGLGWVFTGGGNGAITLGDVGIYPPGFGPGTVMDTASGQTLGLEESFHSQQGRILGPAYLPANIIGGVLGVARNGYWHGPANFMERGPHLVPPRRF
jgi:RHS repeat-associated protein